jgi:hypothetical protein
MKIYLDKKNLITLEINKEYPNAHSALIDNGFFRRESELINIITGETNWEFHMEKFVQSKPYSYVRKIEDYWFTENVGKYKTWQEKDIFEKDKVKYAYIYKNHFNTMIYEIILLKLV